MLAKGELSREAISASEHQTSPIKIWYVSVFCWRGFPFGFAYNFFYRMEFSNVSFHGDASSGPSLDLRYMQAPGAHWQGVHWQGKEEEVVAVLAHELGHWKLSHTMYSFVAIQVWSRTL
ncbi:unnamed protein product [Calypogeia fissa]